MTKEVETLSPHIHILQSSPHWKTLALCERDRMPLTGEEEEGDWWSEIWRGERSAAREPRPASSSLTSPTHNDIPAPLCYTYNTREMRKSGVTRDTARRYLNTVNMTMAHRQHISEQLSKSLSRLWGFWPKTSAYVSLETTILHFKWINICSMTSLLFGY